MAVYFSHGVNSAVFGASDEQWETVRCFAENSANPFPCLKSVVAHGGTWQFSKLREELRCITPLRGLPEDMQTVLKRLLAFVEAATETKREGDVLSAVRLPEMRTILKSDNA